MRALQLDPGNHRELLLRLFFAAPLEMAQLRGHVEAFRREQQARLEHNEDTREWLDDAPGPQSTTTDLEAGPGVRRFAQRVPSDSHTLPFFSMEGTNNVKMLLYNRVLRKASLPRGHPSN